MMKILMIRIFMKMFINLNISVIIILINSKSFYNSKIKLTNQIIKNLIQGNIKEDLSNMSMNMMTLMFNLLNNIMEISQINK